LIAAPYAPGRLLINPRPAETLAVSFTILALATRVCATFIGSVFGGVLIAAGRMDLNALVSIGGNVLRIIVVPLVMTTATPLLALALTVAVTGVLEAAVTAGLARRTDPALTLRFAVPTLAELRMLYGFGLFAFLIQVADKIIAYTDVVVIGFVLGSAEVGPYA